MKMEQVKLEIEELSLLRNKELFLRKKQLGVKINELLGQCVESIQAAMMLNSSHLPQELIHSQPKISKGENYLSFPWQILDYPRIFKKEDVFALRTLCWWGNGLGITLHLSGNYADKYNDVLTKNLELLSQNDFYICIHSDPWQHHFESNNIIPIKEFLEGNQSNSSSLNNQGFIKIVKKYSFDNINELEIVVGKTAEILFKILSK